MVLPAGHRRLRVVRGDPQQTARQASAWLAALAPQRVLWVDAEPCPPFVHATPRQVQRRLGQSFAAVVLGVHAGYEPDVLGQCHGLILGGGALVVRMPPRGETPPPRASLAAHPHAPADVTSRLFAHLERVLKDAELDHSEALVPPTYAPHGNPEQEAVAATLTRLLSSSAPAVATLIAERGRGKSSALGLALRGLTDLSRVAITGPSAGAVQEVQRFAPDLGARPFVPLDALLRNTEGVDAVLVDEAAQLPVPMLQRLVAACPRARLVFATTTGGYEGTGRGFVLRFVQWLQRQGRPMTELTLTEPIRWQADDPLEASVQRALVLDAQPGDARSDIPAERCTPVVLDREQLWRDEALLREFFGLLVHAHYRTTPSDLHRLLDAPNLRLHGLRVDDDGPLVAATMVALEGQLPAGLCDDVYRGRSRLCGHALPESLVSHLGQPEAGALRMVRSVRIAVHPGLRRRGLATRLIEHVHAHYRPDLFGTLFGATPELLHFRRQVGYELVRVGASRGSRTGEPAALMIRPVSSRAHEWMARWRGQLARDLPPQLALLDRGGELWLDDAQRGALLQGLPDPAPYTEALVAERVRMYAHGPRIFENVSVSLKRFVEAHRALLVDLDAQHRTLIEARVVQQRPWAEVAEAARLPGVPAAMRALRRAVRQLVESAPSLTERADSGATEPDV